MSAARSIRPSWIGALVVLALLAFGAAGPLHAQNPASYDERTLQSFAAAMVKVEEVRNVYVPQIEDAGSRDAAQQLQQEANNMMVEAIREEGLDVPMYNEIAQAMRQDRELRGQIMALVEDTRG